MKRWTRAVSTPLTSTKSQGSTADACFDNLYPLFMRYLPLHTTDEDLTKMFLKWASFQEACVFKNTAKNKNSERGFAVFGDPQERVQAMAEVQKPYVLGSRQLMCWMSPGSSLRCKILWEASSFRLSSNKDPPLKRLCRTQEEREWDEEQFYSPSVDPPLQPGFVLMLPPWEIRKPYCYIDPRLEPSAYGHPIILTHRYGDGLWNIVICTSFGGRTPEEVFPNNPASQYRYIQIDSRERKTGGEEMLFLKDYRRMFKTTYAGTESYLVDPQGLIQLWKRDIDDWELSNLYILLDRMKNVRSFYNAGGPRWHPAYAGGRVGRQTRPSPGTGTSEKQPESKQEAEVMDKIMKEGGDIVE